MVVFAMIVAGLVVVLLVSWLVERPRGRPVRRPWRPSADDEARQAQAQLEHERWLGGPGGPSGAGV